MSPLTIMGGLTGGKSKMQWRLGAGARRSTRPGQHFAGVTFEGQVFVNLYDAYLLQTDGQTDCFLATIVETLRFSRFAFGT